MKRSKDSGRTRRVAGVPHSEGGRRLGVLLLLLVVVFGFWAWAPLRRAWLERQPLSSLAASVASHPADTTAALILAERYLAEGEAAQAEGVLLRLLEKDRANPRAWLLRSRAEFDQGKRGAAKATLMQAMPFLDSSAEAHWRMGLLHERVGEVSAAEVEFHRALERDPHYVGAHLELARVALGRGESGPALEHLDGAVRREPENVAVLEMLSVAHRQLGHLDQAEQNARKAVRRAPRSGGAWRSLAEALQDRATEPALREAEQAYRQALALDPDSCDLHYGIGKIYFALGDYARAAAELQRAIDIKPLYGQAYPTLIQCYQRLGQAPRADRLSAEYRKIDEMGLSTEPLEHSVYVMPENTALRMRLARLYARYHRPDLALDQMERILEINPNHAEAGRLRDQLKAAVGRKEKGG